ncbi:MAG: hypothetical protein SNJ59_03355 [Aggregatilineales bacterium]
MRKRYLVSGVLAMFAVLVGCSGLNIGASQPTPVPFDRHTAEDVLRAFSVAGLPVQNVQRDMLIGRGAPSTFSDRYVFEIERIAPLGGQILIFSTAGALAEWENYIAQLRANSSTRRDVVYVFVKDNVMLQVNAALTTQEANAFRAALNSLSS